MLFRSTFPEDALERIRTSALQGLKMGKQVPGPQVNKAFQRTLFGDHPYGHPQSGTLESLPGEPAAQSVAPGGPVRRHQGGPRQGDPARRH